jgi:GGDEF domain-containing protein
MADLPEESGGYFSQNLSHVHRKLMTSLYHVADVLVSEIKDSRTDHFKQQALQSAAADLAEAIEDVRTLEKLRDKILADESAGIMSFRRFLDQLGVAIDHSRRTKSPLGLLVLEFEWPAVQLDKSSCARVDQFIREAAQILKVQCGRSDFLGRSADTGFMLALIGADIEKSSEVAEELNEALNKHPLYEVCDIDYHIGVAAWPLHASQREDLVFLAQQLARSSRLVTGESINSPRKAKT